MTTTTRDDQASAETAPSNRCGFTLLTSQVGQVVADVMEEKSGIEITRLPAMIRVDGGERIDVIYDEIAEELGVDDFDHSELEEIQSTHYGRMVHTDDRTIFFANPEDAAEYLGFDLTPVQE